MVGREAEPVGLGEGQFVLVPQSKITRFIGLRNGAVNASAKFLARPFEALFVRASSFQAGCDMRATAFVWRIVPMAFRANLSLRDGASSGTSLTSGNKTTGKWWK